MTAEVQETVAEVLKPLDPTVVKKVGGTVRWMEDGRADVQQFKERKDQGWMALKLGSSILSMWFEWETMKMLEDRSD